MEHGFHVDSLEHIFREVVFDLSHVIQRVTRKVTYDSEQLISLKVELEQVHAS